MITEYGKEESVSEIENYVIQNGYNTKRHKVTLDNMEELITNLKKESEQDPQSNMIIFNLCDGTDEGDGGDGYPGVSLIILL